MPALDRHAGGALICTIHLNLIIYTKPWPRINELCRKKNQSQKPAHGPPLQARVVAANRTVRTTCASILAHMEMNRGGKAKLNGARTLRAAGMEWQRWQASKAGRTGPLQANTAGR